MNTETVKIETLLHDPSNARLHNDKNLSAIKGSLTKYGQQKPIVVNRKNIVLAGNGTLAAARELGWDEIVIVRSELTGSDATGFSLADNRTAELATWDNDILGPMLHALREEDYDLGAIGFDTSSLDEMQPLPDLEPTPEPDPTDKPPKYSITVTFENDEDQQDLFSELRDRGFKVKV